MRRVGGLGLLGLVVAGVMTGCFEETPQQRAEAVCTAYCDCFVTAGRVPECVAECVPNIPLVSDECLNCVVSNSQTCSALDELCFDACSTGQP